MDNEDQANETCSYNYDMCTDSPPVVHNPTTFLETFMEETTMLEGYVTKASSLVYDGHMSYNGMSEPLLVSASSSVFQYTTISTEEASQTACAIPASDFTQATQLKTTTDTLTIRQPEHLEPEKTLDSFVHAQDLAAPLLESKPVAAVVSTHADPVDFIVDNSLSCNGSVLKDIPTKNFPKPAAKKKNIYRSKHKYPPNQLDSTPDLINSATNSFKQSGPAYKILTVKKRLGRTTAKQGLKAIQATDSKLSDSESITSDQKQPNKPDSASIATATKAVASKRSQGKLLQQPKVWMLGDISTFVQNLNSVISCQVFIRNLHHLLHGSTPVVTTYYQEILEYSGFDVSDNNIVNSMEERLDEWTLEGLYILSDMLTVNIRCKKPILVELMLHILSNPIIVHNRVLLWAIMFRVLPKPAQKVVARPIGREKPMIKPRQKKSKQGHSSDEEEYLPESCKQLLRFKRKRTKEQLDRIDNMPRSKSYRKILVKSRPIQSPDQDKAPETLDTVILSKEENCIVSEPIMADKQLDEGIECSVFTDIHSTEQSQSCLTDPQESDSMPAPIKVGFEKTTFAT
ncbi:hypothetical protein QVD99_002235 [Batrachochytrium dendrobatidis]|nr:hypothetical protein QVD99_002235 [Batrachochytrium dendrobatidis]